MPAPGMGRTPDPSAPRGDLPSAARRPAATTEGAPHDHDHPQDRAVTAPQRRRTVGQWVVVLALFGAAAVVFALLRQGEAASAATGDCLEPAGDDALAVVSCDDPAAAHVVLGRLEGRTSIDAGLFACSDVAGATASYWEGPEGVGELGTVLCLGPPR